MKIEELLKTITVTASTLCFMGSLANGADLSQRDAMSFNIYDTNKNGYISESEFYDTRAKRQSKRATQGMTMKNAGDAPDFTLFDKNKDGKLTKLELIEGQNSQMQNRRSNRGNMNKGQSKNKQGMGQGRGNNQGNNSRRIRRNMPTFENYDLNNDGYLTENEMNKAKSNRTGRNSTPFPNIDKNNDGKISKIEFLANQSRKR